MNNVPHPSGNSAWYMALPWVCRGFGALIVAVLMVTLWTLLLFFNVRWWIILLTIIIPAIPLAIWLWYWTHIPEIIPSAVNSTVNSAVDSASVKIDL
jgi:hypothetical protein